MASRVDSQGMVVVDCWVEVVVEAFLAGVGLVLVGMVVEDLVVVVEGDPVHLVQVHLVLEQEGSFEVGKPVGIAGKENHK